MSNSTPLFQDLENSNEKSREPTTREISKLVTFYLKNVRNHPKEEMLGIYRNIMSMVKKQKVTMTEMSAAVQNYAKDDWVKSVLPRRRLHIRTFFTPEKIKEWVEPQSRRPIDPALAALDRLAEAAPQPKAAAPSQSMPVTTDEEPEWPENL
jgi:hypothetical protein